MLKLSLVLWVHDFHCGCSQEVIPHMEFLTVHNAVYKSSMCLFGLLWKSVSHKSRRISQSGDSFVTGHP
jgi:hypothetical protein